jgi:hypothetical protein
MSNTSLVGNDTEHDNYPNLNTSYSETAQKNIYLLVYFIYGARGSVVVEALSYEPQSRGIAFR